MSSRLQELAELVWSWWEVSKKKKTGSNWVLTISFSLLLFSVT